MPVELVSGFVTERTAVGVRPVAEASVEHFYGDGLAGDPTGFTLTNADGYYACAAIPTITGSKCASRRTDTVLPYSLGPSAKIDFELVRE